MTRKGRILRGVLVALVVACLVWGWTAYTIVAYADQRDSAPADVAIVLGAAVWGDAPSPVFRERINHAVALYQAERVARLLFTGGEGQPGEPAEAVAARAYVMERGVPETATLVETRSHTTWQNLAYARDLLDEDARVLIVSDPLHMKRAVFMARDLGMDAYPAPTPTTRYRSLGTQVGFLMRETYFYLSYWVRRPFVLSRGA